MRIEIIIRDTDTHGKRFGGGKVRLESCRVFKQSGDGLRLDNICRLAYQWFHGAAMLFIQDDPSKGGAFGKIGNDAMVEKRLEQYCADGTEKGADK